LLEYIALVSNQAQLTDSSAGIFCAAKFDDTGAARATIRLILDLSTFDLADGGEQFNQILVAGRPGQLRFVNNPFSGWDFGNNLRYGRR
jgi:hypothetical protein